MVRKMTHEQFHIKVVHNDGGRNIFCTSCGKDYEKLLIIESDSYETLPMCPMCSVLTLGKWEAKILVNMENVHIDLEVDE